MTGFSPFAVNCALSQLNWVAILGLQHMHASDCVHSAGFRKSPESNATDVFELQPGEEKLWRPEHLQSVQVSLNSLDRSTLARKGLYLRTRVLEAVSGSTPAQFWASRDKAEHHVQVESLGNGTNPVSTPNNPPLSASTRGDPSSLEPEPSTPVDRLCSQ
ncbi:hypothetical protein DFP72DRAFT_886591, partial [Ephemerocybe angulata]